MSTNFLEELAAEWYEYKGYFIRRNVLVGKRPAGGHECELDVVGFHPETRHLVHIEASMDAAKWEERERRFQKKFGASPAGRDAASGHAQSHGHLHRHANHGSVDGAH